MSWQALNLESEPWLPAQALSPATRLCRSPPVLDGVRPAQPCSAQPGRPPHLARAPLEIMAGKCSEKNKVLCRCQGLSVLLRSVITAIQKSCH